MDKKKNTVGALLTLIGGCCWGLSGSMGQYLFTREGMDTSWLVPIRLGLAGVVLFLYCLRKERKRLFGIWCSRRSAFLMFVYGFVGVSLCQFFYFLTIQLSSASIGTILQDLAPVMILFCSCYVEKRNPHRYEISCLVLAMVGVLLIVTHGDVSKIHVPLSAVAAGVISAVGVTIYNMLTEELTREYPVVVLQTWSFLMGGVVLGLFFHPWTVSYVPTLMGYFGIAFVVLVGNVLAFTTYIKGVSYIGPSKGILYGFSEPVTAALVSVFLLGSDFGIFDLAGFLAIFMMLGIISYHTREERNSGNVCVEE